MDFELLAKTTLGKIDESFHHGIIVVCKSSGEIVFSAGNPQRYFFPRSSFKLIQTLGVLQSGAAETFQISDRQIALACASHDAQEFHTEEVQKWLGKLNFTPQDLACGAAYPKHFVTRKKMIRSNTLPETFHHECSGKHCGFLTGCRFLELNSKGYQLLKHPVQLKVQEYFSVLSEIPAEKIYWGIDGCCLPTPAFPIEKMARVLALYSDPDKNPVAQKFKKSFERIISSVTDFPEFVSGTENQEAKLIRWFKGKLILKSGAEGIYAAILPQKQLGIVIKIADGNPRSLSIILIRLLKKLNLVTESEYQEITELCRTEIVNSRGNPTGKIHPVF